MFHLIPKRRLLILGLAAFILGLSIANWEHFRFASSPWQANLLAAQDTNLANSGCTYNRSLGGIDSIDCQANITINGNSSSCELDNNKTIRLKTGVFNAKCSFSSGTKPLSNIYLARTLALAPRSSDDENPADFNFSEGHVISLAAFDGESPVVWGIEDIKDAWTKDSKNYLELNDKILQYQQTDKYWKVVSATKPTYVFNPCQDYNNNELNSTICFTNNNLNVNKMLITDFLKDGVTEYKAIYIPNNGDTWYEGKIKKNTNNTYSWSVEPFLRGAFPIDKKIKIKYANLAMLFPSGGAEAWLL
ncbi:MAG TPA: hypothetical protein PLQ36_03810, partial [Candidatus Gracilibacteria bacterium]|nr:hypothetical protein [Candidatus Gracilibacteria bacterium]